MARTTICTVEGFPLESILGFATFSAVVTGMTDEEVVFQSQLCLLIQETSGGKYLEFGVNCTLSIIIFFLVHPLLES